MTTVGAGNVGAGHSLGIQRTVRLINAGCQKSLGRVFAKHGIAHKFRVRGNVHDFIRAKPEPADRADQIAFVGGHD